MSLYLTYRPKTFADLVGQRHIIDILVAQAKQQQLGHSYLLFGPRGTGKTSTARLLAKIINCTTFTADGNPDLLNDPAAQLIDQNKTLDFVEIDAASHTGVDNIREEIIDKALYPPAHLKKKVYVIDEVHMLSKGAFNALLKIMEEPPSYLIFILATTELHKVPDTIISRCQVFNFKQLSIDEITSRLTYIATQEQIAYEPEALRLIAKLSGGALRDAIKYLEQISILGEVTEEHVARFLGVVNDRLLTQGIDLLIGAERTAWIHFLDSLVQQGVDLSNFAKELLVRLDEHFLEKPDTYASLAGMLREIISESKWYPHPLLVWKAKTWHWFGNNGQGTSDNGKAESGTELKATSGTELKAEKTEELQTESGSLQSAPSISESPEASSHIPSSLPPASSPLSPEMVIETLVAHSKNPMLKAALKQQVIIQEITPATIGAIVINEQFYHTLSKPETSRELDHILQEKLAYTGELKRTYMTKEERLMRHM